MIKRGANSQKLTEGSILKTLIKLSIPLILTNILQTAYNLTDTFWVGRLGKVAVAAVSLSFPIVFIIISLGSGLAIAGSILSAQKKGEEDTKSIDHIATQTFLSIMLIALLLSVIGYFISPYLITFMHVEPDVYQDALAYLQISFFGLVPLYMFMIFQSMMRSIGEVVLPFFIVLSTVLLNLALDPLFIFGWHDIIPANGVKGAAIATVSTQLLAAGISAFMLFSGKKGIRIRFTDYKPDFPLLKKLFKVGAPVSIEQVSRALGIFAMVKLVTYFGTLAIASYGIGSRILSFVIIPAFGLGMATSTLVGQNIGAKQYNRVKKTLQLSMGIAFGVMTFLGIIFYFFAPAIAKFFIPNDLETIQSSAVFIRYIAVSFGFMGVLIVLIGAFRGAGRTKISMALALFSVWIIRFPLAYYLSHFTNFKEIGIWISYPVTNIATAVVGFIILIKFHWLTKEKSL